MNIFKNEKIMQIINIAGLAVLVHFAMQYFLKSPPPPPQSRLQMEQVLKNRDYFDSDMLKGSIRTDGCILDFLQFKNHESRDKPLTSDSIKKYNLPEDMKEKSGSKYNNHTLLYPEGSKREFTNRVAFTGLGAPDVYAKWKKVNNAYQWSNKQWLIEQEYKIFGYLTLLTVRVKNLSNSTQRMQVSNVMTHAVPKTDNSMGYEGAFLANGNFYTKTGLDYSSLKNKDFSYNNYSGWMCLTDRYWLAAVTGHDNSDVLTTSKGEVIDFEFRNKAIDVVSQGEATYLYKFYFGPKDLKELRRVENKVNMKGLEDSIDYGWFSILTKPIFAALSMFVEFLKSPAWALILFALLAKVLLVPLTYRTQQSMKSMQELQPKIKAIQERYKDQPQVAQMQMLDLYKQHGVNPLSGCLPIILQLILFVPIYRVLNLLIAFRKASFVGWISDLSAPDPTSISNLFGLMPWEPISWIGFGLWPILMAMSVVLTQLDAENKKMTWILAVFIAFMSSNLPAAVTIFWTLFNLLSFAQKYVVAYIKDSLIK